mgnify:FL=1
MPVSREYEDSAILEPKRGVFRAFQHRNFRLFIIGQLLSLIGTWAQRLGVAWLAWELTHSPFWVGATAFTGLFPGVLAGPIAGSVADRMDRFRLLKITQVLFLLHAVVLSVMTITNAISIELLLLLEAFLAVISAFDIPVRQALVIDLVGKDDLANGIAINSSTVNITRMIGPAVAGVIILMFGIGEAFAFNAFSYIAVLISLSMMKMHARVRVQRNQSVSAHIHSGLRYAWNTPDIRNWLLLFFFLALFGMPYGSLMPVVAEIGFGRGAEGLTWLVVASGLGATSGALLLAAQKSTRRLPRLLPVGAVAFGLLLLVFGLIDTFWLAVAILPFCGYAMMLQMAGINIVLQTKVAEEHRGRVMSLLSMAFQSAFPLGSLWMGWVAEHYGVSLPFTIAGSLTVVSSFAVGTIIRLRQKS